MLIHFIWAWFKGSDLKFFYSHESRRSGRLETQTNTVDEDGSEWATPWVGRAFGLGQTPCGLGYGSPFAYVLVQRGVLCLWVLVHCVSAGESVALAHKWNKGWKTKTLPVWIQRSSNFYSIKVHEESVAPPFFCYHYLFIYFVVVFLTWQIGHAKHGSQKIICQVFIFTIFSRETLLFYFLFIIHQFYLCS
jgi:hypothetical protein